ADRGNRCLQFVCDRIDKAVMLFVPANLSQQESCVENDARSHGGKKDDTKKHFDIGSPVKDDPAHPYGHSYTGQAYSQNEEGNGCPSAAGRGAGEILPARGQIGAKWVGG